MSVVHVSLLTLRFLPQAESCLFEMHGGERLRREGGGLVPYGFFCSSKLCVCVWCVYVCMSVCVRILRRQSFRDYCNEQDSRATSNASLLRALLDRS